MSEHYDWCECRPCRAVRWLTRPRLSVLAAVGYIAGSVLGRGVAMAVISG